MSERLESSSIKSRSRAQSICKLPFKKNNPTSQIREQQRKAARYEAMVDRLQVRRVDRRGRLGTPSKFTSKDLIIDTRLVGGKSFHNHYQRSSLRRLTRKLSRRALKAVTSTGPAHLNRCLAAIHFVVMLIAYHFQIFYLPFAPVFYPKGSMGTTVVNAVLEAISLLDVILNFVVGDAAQVRDKPGTPRIKTASRYARSWFLFDLIASLPLHIVGLALGEHCTSTSSPVLIHGTPLVMMRLLRFGRRGFVHRIDLRFVRWVRYSRYSHLVGIVRLLWFVLVIAHYMACFWHLLDRDQPLPDQSIAEKYIANYYYAVILIHGQGNIMDDWRQNLFSTALVIIGSVIVATIFGNVAMLVSNFNASATNYQRKMEGVYATMEKMELPDRLRERIQQYYAHVWTEYESLDGDLVKFQHELTHTLGLEVGLYKYMSLVNDIPFWVDCSPDFIAQIVLMLVVRVYLPDDYVVRQGEICDEMFMVNRGVCEVSKTESEPYIGYDGYSECGVNDDNYERVTNSAQLKTPHPWPLTTLSAFDELSRSLPASAQVHPDSNRSAFAPLTRTSTLQSGQYFSEMSLLMNYQQTGSVRAMCFVEMCVLERDSFQRTISRFPEDRRRVLTCMLKNSIVKNEAPTEWTRQCMDKIERGGNKATAATMAEVMTDLIDVEQPDETIKYGFRYAVASPTSKALRSSIDSDEAALPANNTTHVGNDRTVGEDTSMASTVKALFAAICRIERDVQQIKSDIVSLKSGRDGKEVVSQEITTDASDESTSAVQPHTHEGTYVSELSALPLRNLRPPRKLPQLFDAAQPSRSELSVVDPSSARSILDSTPVRNENSEITATDDAVPLGHATKQITELGSSDPITGAQAHQRAESAGNEDSLTVGAGLKFSPLLHTKPRRRSGEQLGSGGATLTFFGRHGNGGVMADPGPDRPLRKRFLISRLSNPSYKRNISDAKQRPRPDQEMTLADQLWEQRHL